MEKFAWIQDSSWAMACFAVSSFWSTVEACEHFAGGVATEHLLLILPSSVSMWAEILLSRSSTRAAILAHLAEAAGVASHFAFRA